MLDKQVCRCSGKSMLCSFFIITRIINQGSSFGALIPLSHLDILSQHLPMADSAL